MVNSPIMGKQMKRLALDIETNLVIDTIWCCCTYDLDTKEVKVFTDGQSLNTYLEDAAVIAAHNGCGFDFKVLNKLWKTSIRRSQIADTLIMSRLLSPVRENGHSLAELAKLVGEIKKEFEDFDSGISETMIEYCKQDAIIAGKLYEHFIQHFTEEPKKTQTNTKALDLELDVQLLISDQIANGFKLDIPYAMSLLSTIKSEMSEIESQMETTFPTIVRERYSEKTGKRLKDEIITFNPGSRKQIHERLEEKYGWKPQKLTEKGTPIVDEDVLSKLDYPEAKFLARYFMLQKRASMLDSWLEKVGKDGRVHGKVITIGAVTGRCTHSDPNMAQVPAVRAEYGKEFRSCWIVDEGNVLVGTDLSGIELRCFAHYLNDPEYTEEVVNGDVHTRNQHAFGVDSRDLAKTILYATLYGASAGKVGRIIGKGDKDGKQIIENFSKSVPAYKRLKEKVEKLSEKGSLPGLDGRRLQVRSAHSALNTLLQSAGAIIAKKWLVVAKQELKKAKIPYKQVAFVHDEAQIEVAEQYGKQVGEIMVAAAAQAGVELGFRCPVGAEFKIGRNWCECH